MSGVEQASTCLFIRFLPNCNSKPMTKEEGVTGAVASLELVLGSGRTESSATGDLHYGNGHMRACCKAGVLLSSLVGLWRDSTFARIFYRVCSRGG